ncbi:glycoside hydrolase family 5 [Granulicella tundricola MP5ACTX9]|uniref:Glycoside hydrolase family 5 n=2 Tax=Granulicella TaxID=940557 RepID=E8WWW5_GRATM|nr:glycoside hydrolase family 5 [Granulicella tundricola MP5ACTX9]
MAAVAGGQRGSSLAFQRAEHLRRGINLSMWYAQSGDYSAGRLESFTTPDDFKLIKGLGFDHVRVSIDPDPLIAMPMSGALRPEAMARLDKTVAQLEAAGLNVVLDVHAGQDFVGKLANGEDGAANFFSFWSEFAKHFAGTDPEKVFFEVLNEPTMTDLYRWEGIQARAVARIRSVAPQHTILATASNYSGIDTLLALEPVRDENVIYTFHDYEPFWFTHQGANWGAQGWIFLRGVPYPATPQTIGKVLGQEQDERVRLWVQRFGYDHWDATRVGMEIAAAADWAQKRGVPLYCGEFGVYRTYADAKSRDTWISDMRTALESKHICWAMWDYQGDFGIVTKGSGGTMVDLGVVGALGLKGR